MSDDLLPFDPDDASSDEPLNFDLNPDLLTPTSKRTPRASSASDDDESDDTGESLEESRREELADLEVDDDYFFGGDGDLET